MSGHQFSVKPIRVNDDTLHHIHKVLSRYPPEYKKDTALDLCLL
jgi:hypothetical protein